MTDEYEKIKKYIRLENPFIISVNFLDRKFTCDACFVSNHKRIESIKKELHKNEDIFVIVTSNIEFPENRNVFQVDYYSYINEDEAVVDNAGLMLFSLLIRCGIDKLVLAGFDGFRIGDNNYYNADASLNNYVEESVLKEKQNRIKEQIKRISRKIRIEFLTKSAYMEAE